MNALIEFYSFETTARIKWLNYISSQNAIQQSVNILLNGGKKYNKKKKKKQSKVFYCSSPPTKQKETC
jgi:hypothetical protein